MLRMPYRLCLLAFLSVPNRVSAATPPETPVKMEPAPEMKSGRALTTAPSPDEDCAALNDKNTCSKKDRKRVGEACSGETPKKCTEMCVSPASNRKSLSAKCKEACCKMPATENPVYTLGLAARRNTQMAFVTSLNHYVPPGSRYEQTVWNNGTHDLCPYLFSKTLEHDRVTSFPLCSHVDKLLEALSAPPHTEEFDAIPLAPDSVRKLESPQSGWDCMLMTSPATTTATATKVTDPEFGFEIAEVFAMALLRDKPFASWAQDADVQQVIDVLNSYHHKSTAPREGGVITINTLMRGAGADETIGPYAPTATTLGCVIGAICAPAPSAN